ncbi:MAG: P1 family peptidase [Nitrospinae bacterium]|nr:P1 family peptidase [Nitrospinota bacterium]
MGQPVSFRALKTKIGHVTLGVKKTGCTVLLFDEPSVCSGHVAGGAPGTRDGDMLDPSCLVEKANAIVLTGGSAFGLATADGVMRFLSERGVGFAVGSDRVPIVPAAVIYDRGVGEATYPSAKDGYRACLNAGYSADKSGPIGVGCGATVGKFSKKLRPSPGGFGAVCLRTRAGVYVGAVVAVNAFGNVVDPDGGNLICGAMDKRGKIVSFGSAIVSGRAGENTTIGAVVTNAGLTKSQAKRISMCAHDGLARAVFPCHTIYDGDTIYAVSTGKVRADMVELGAVAVRAVELAVLKAVGGNKIESRIQK